MQIHNANSQSNVNYMHSHAIQPFLPSQNSHGIFPGGDGSRLPGFAVPMDRESRILNMMEKLINTIISLFSGMFGRGEVNTPAQSKPKGSSFGNIISKGIDFVGGLFGGGGSGSGWLSSISSGIGKIGKIFGF